MFKIQKKLQSMDFNKNIERYKFNPNYTYSTLTKKVNNVKDYNIFYENIREKALNRTNRFPPVYFYKKVTTPYKYNITSVPEYLIRTNEEKRFMDKLYKSLTNEKDRKMLKDLLNKNTKKNKNKNDYFKPKVIDVHRMLRYKPYLYTNLSDPLKIDKYNLMQRQSFKEIKSDNKSNENKTVVNSCPNNDNILSNNDKYDNDDNLTKENNINNERKEITKEEQIKYKYKLSDIFNIRKEPVFLNKSAEKYLFKNMKKSTNNLTKTSPNMNSTNTVPEEIRENKFYTSSESNSDWIPNKMNKKKMGTNSSVAYNILCPMYKGTNKFINASELNKNNMYNESPAFRRVKSISEFIDLTRVSATNTLGCFNRNMKIPNFKFNNSVATNQLDAFHINRNLLEKPI